MLSGARYRKGDTDPRSVAVDSATVIEVGDMIYLVSGKAKPAADLAWDTNIATTQETFHDAFLGVALQRSRDGDTDDIAYASKGEFEFDCASATFAMGALVGVAKQSGDAIENQKVVGVAGANLAVGRVTRIVTSAATTVHVAIESVVNHGGVQAAA